MKNDFEIINHTADIGIIAYGANISEAFAKAAEAMFSLITEIGKVDETLYRDIKLTAPDQETLLVEWLNELIYLFDTENIIFKRFDITWLNSSLLKARSYGERVDSSKHKFKMGIKAATHHMLKIEKNYICKIQVLFDI